jgi:hypothetical protein
MLKRAPAETALALVALLTAACSREGEVRRYQEVTIQAAPPAAAESPMGGGRGQMTGNVPTAGLRLSWDTPAGWTEKAGGSMRLATFLVGGAECSLSAFPGNTGGVEANLRRWLGQIDAEGSDEQIAGLMQRASAFQTKAGWDGQAFDLSTALPDGATNGMRAAIIPVDGQSVFVKFMGPVDVLEKERAAFAALCASLRPAEGAAPAAAEASATPAAPAAPMMAPGAMAGQMTGNVPTAGLSLMWKTPAGWTDKGATSMRLATFTLPGGECSITAFPGDTGGEEANLRRWLGQLQASPTPAQLVQLGAAAVPFKTEAGWEGKLFDLTAALPADAASGMRAAIIPVQGQTVFVKLSGPPALLAEQAEALLALCRSLQPRG